MGYYGGSGARKVATVQPLAVLPQLQPGCLSNAATRPGRLRQLERLGDLVGPGGRGVRHLLRQARARRRRRRVEPHHVRRPRRRRARRRAVPDLGHHLAGLQPVRRQQPLHRLPRRPRLQGQLQPAVHHARLRGAEDWVFNAEYPMVRFLERNGYNLSYSTGIDSDRRGAELLEHKTFLSVGHDEYWSGTQRSNVEAARAAGVHLAFFSGNEVFWKTRLEPSIDGTGTPNRTLVVLQGDPRERQDRPAARRLDGHVARPALQPAGRRRPARERAHGPDLHGQQPARARSGCRPPTARCASGATPRSPPRRPARRPRCRAARWATSGTRTSTTGPGRRGRSGSPPRRSPARTCCRTTARRTAPARPPTT